MKRSRLQSIYFKNKSYQNMLNHKRQINFCSRLNKREKKNYYSNLELKSIMDKKIFWKTMKPLFSDKGCHKPKITLIDEGKITSEDQEVSNIFNEYFTNAITCSEIETEHKDNEVNFDASTNFIIDEHKHHPSISSIKTK